jgi:hypothetical protein
MVTEFVARLAHEGETGMGLDTTHDCWHGAYSSFNIWRVAVCDAAGWGALDNYQGFGGPESFPEHDVLTQLLEHSDCDGDLKWEICGELADRLEGLLPKIAAKDSLPSFPYLADKTRQFIDGLRDAHETRTNVEFH